MLPYSLMLAYIRTYGIAQPQMLPSLALPCAGYSHHITSGPASSSTSGGGAGPATSSGGGLRERGSAILDKGASIFDRAKDKSAAVFDKAKDKGVAALAKARDGLNEGKDKLSNMAQVREWGREGVLWVCVCGGNA